VADQRKAARALDGVKILAFEQVLSGPFATCLLADMGAEVIKVERPGVGDVIRSWDSVVKGLSSGYVWLNRNKRSLTVDVKKEKGREILQELAKRSDIFFENYAPRVAGRLGLGYEKLSELNPRLIYCSLSGYGQDGPYRDVKAYDLLIQGEGGIIATTGYPDKPARAGIAIADIASGMYAVIGILLALYQREKTGEGQLIDVSVSISPIFDRHGAITGVSKSALSIVFTSLHFKSVPNGMNRSGAGSRGSPRPSAGVSPSSVSASPKSAGNSARSPRPRSATSRAGAFPRSASSRTASASSSKARRPSCGAPGCQTDCTNFAPCSFRMR